MLHLKIFGRTHWLTLSLLLPFSPLFAQSFPPADGAAIIVPPPSNDPADRLAANLVLLSQNPKNVSALIDAGRSAIAVGDYDAALSFLARAEELAPSNGRVKAALGSALVMVERPADAIRLFAEAAALGAPESEIAGDRGLAYDLQGDNRRAQRDYQMVLRSRSDDEVTRRLALSLGISGDRDQALRMLDPLLRRQDPTGWRARAFVLAMNGDVRSAENIAASVMPAGMSDTMRPFLRKLAQLNAADRAHAVNFGTMPSDSTRFAAVDTARLIPAPELASATAGEQSAKPRKGEGASKAPRRRPGKDDIKVAPTPPTQVAKASQAGPGFSDIFLNSTVPQAAKVDAQKPIETARLDQRLGTRIGPVDPERLSPEVRAAIARDGEKLPPKVTVVQGSVLPPPDQRIAVVSAARPPAPASIAKAPEPEEIDQPANAVFEVAAVPTPKPQDKPAIILTSAAPTKLPETKPLEVLPKPVVEGPPPAVIVGGPPPPAQTQVVQTQTVAAAAAPVQLAVVTTAPPAASIETATPAVGPVSAPVTQQARGLAGLLNDIEPEPESVAVALPTEAQIKIARIAAQRKIADAAAKVKAEKDSVAKAEKAKADKEAAAAAALAKRNPPRVWVQVATGANESGLGITWKRLREKAPDAFKGLSASYTPFKATNRVLVGPFKSNAEARTLVNMMSKAGLSGNTFASEAGQEILKIASK
jgi:tetratricopeptide (TPR) repeat protein